MRKKEINSLGPTPRNADTDKNLKLKPYSGSTLKNALGNDGLHTFRGINERRRINQGLHWNLIGRNLTQLRGSVKLDFEKERV